MDFDNEEIRTIYTLKKILAGVYEYVVLTCR